MQTELFEFNPLEESPLSPLSIPDRPILQRLHNNKRKRGLSTFMDWDDYEIPRTHQQALDFLHKAGTVFPDGNRKPELVAYSDLTVSRQVTVLYKVCLRIPDVEAFIATMPKGKWTDFNDAETEPEERDEALGPALEQRGDDGSMVARAPAPSQSQGSDAVEVMNAMHATVEAIPGGKRRPKAEDGTDTLPGQLDTSCYRGMDHEQSLGAANRALAHPSKHRKKTNSGRIAQSFKGSPWVTAGPNGFKRPARYMVPKSYREWRFETW